MLESQLLFVYLSVFGTKGDNLGHIITAHFFFTQKDFLKFYL